MGGGASVSGNGGVVKGKFSSEFGTLKIRPGSVVSIVVVVVVVVVVVAVVIIIAVCSVQSLVHFIDRNSKMGSTRSSSGGGGGSGDASSCIVPSGL